MRYLALLCLVTYVVCSGVRFWARLTAVVGLAQGLEALHSAIGGPDLVLNSPGALESFILCTVMCRLV